MAKLQIQEILNLFSFRSFQRSVSIDVTLERSDFGGQFCQLTFLPSRTFLLPLPEAPKGLLYFLPFIKRQGVGIDQRPKCPLVLMLISLCLDLQWSGDQLVWTNHSTHAYLLQQTHFNNETFKYIFHTTDKCFEETICNNVSQFAVYHKQT